MEFFDQTLIGSISSTLPVLFKVGFSTSGPIICPFLLCAAVQWLLISNGKQTKTMLLTLLAVAVLSEIIWIIGGDISELAILGLLAWPGFFGALVAILLPRFWKQLCRWVVQTGSS